MTYKEIFNGLKGKESIPRDLIKDRVRDGFAFLIAPSASYFVTGKEIDELHDLIIPKERNEKKSELKGQSAFKGNATGKARVIIDRRHASQLKPGEILVTTMTSPDFVPAMRISSGIITNEGGILCHAAIMSRELRKPCIIGTKNATEIIKTGDLIELNADKGVIKILKNN